MGAYSTARHLKTPIPFFTLTRSGALQERHAYDERAVADGEFAECRNNREATLQRAAVNATPVSQVPSIVHDVLRLPGQPLDAATRAFMESRFGHHFSRVRVHADARAAEPARAVHGGLKS